MQKKSRRPSFFRVIMWVAVWVMSLSFYSSACYAGKQGTALIDSLLAELPRMKEDTSKVELLADLGNIYSSIDPNKGIRYATDALALAEKLEWDNGRARAYNILGICSEYKSDGNKSIVYWQKALEIYERDHNKRGILKIVGNLGVVYGLHGDYARALENNLLALRYAEELGDKVSMAINLGNIGSDYEYLGDIKKALEYDFKALKIAEERRDTQGMALYFSNIGNCYSAQNNVEEALKYQFTALKYNEYLGNTEGSTRDMINISTILNGKGEFGKALEYLHKTIDISRQAGFKITESKALNVRAATYLKMATDSSKDGAAKGISQELKTKYSIPEGKTSLLNEAIRDLKKSIELIAETGDLDLLQTNYQMLSQAQALAGLYSDALESKNKYIVFKDSVFSMQSKIAIGNIETRRELELKDKQIELDRLAVEKKRNERAFFIAGFVLLVTVVFIVIRNMRLAAAKELSENKLNAFQARMNPHFIFNSLSSIQSLMMNNETETSIDYLSEFATLMRQILDTSAQSKVLLKTEIEMLRSYIQLEHLRFDCFTWDIHIAGDLAADAIEVPGMIVQPFVENAILHGLIPKGQNGVLAISFEKAGGQVVCTVDDNGIGRERSAELNKNRHKSRQSHGVNIAVNRLTLLNDKKKGLVNKVVYIDKVEHGEPAGTKVIIQIPIL